MPFAPLPPEIRETIATRLRDWASVAQIARETGASCATVRRIAASEGIALKPGRPTGSRSARVERAIARARSLQRDGKNIREIANILGLSMRSVSGYVSDGKRKKTT